MKVSSILRFIVAALIIAAVVFHVRKGTFNPGTSYDGENPDGKLLGVVADGPGFGGYEVAVGLMAATGLWLGAAVLHKLPMVGKYAPTAQAPT